MKKDEKIALAVFLVLAAIYWTGRSLSFGAGDSPQHVLSALTYGVSWPPGYPLYNLLGFLLSRLPGSTPEGWINGFSGLCHAATCALLFLSLRRLKLETPAALCAVALMAFSPLFWYYSEVAEVRALNDLLAVAAFYLAVRWSQDKKRPALYGLALVLGLGISHHPTYVLILPAIAFWLWRKKVLPSKRELPLFCLPLVGACAVPYLILGVRLHASAPVYNPMAVASWRDVLDLFLRKNLGGPLRMVGGHGVFDLGTFQWGPLALQLGWLAHSAWWEPGLLGALLCALGAAALWKKDRPLLEFWAVWLGVSLAAFLFLSSQQLHLHDPDYARAIAMRFYLMPFVALFTIAGFGAQWLAARTHKNVAWGLAAAALIGFFTNPVRLGGQDPLLHYGEDLLASSGPEDIVILAADDTVLVMNYLDYVAHRAERRVFLNPVLFAFKPYLAELKVRYPGLVLPAPGPAGLPLDWRLWMKLNPGRRLYSEAMFLNVLGRDFPKLAPRGALIAVSERSSGPVAVEARTFLDTATIARLRMTDLHPWTQEIYLARTASLMLAWYGSLLDEKKDAAVVAEIRARLSAL